MTWSRRLFAAMRWFAAAVVVAGLGAHEVEGQIGSLPRLSERVSLPEGEDPSPCWEFACYEDAVIDGDTVAAVGSGYMAIYVFVKDGAGDWVPQAVIENPHPSFDPSANPFEADPTRRRFGTGLALSEDELMFPYTHYDEASDTRTSQVFVYRRTGATWEHVQTIVTNTAEVPGGGLALYRGTAVIGDTVLARRRNGLYEVTDRLETRDGNTVGNIQIARGMMVGRGYAAGDDMGAVHVFERGWSGWREVQKLTPTTGLPGSGFGSVLATDGHRIAIGAPGAEDPVVEIYGRRGRRFHLEQVIDSSALPADLEAFTGFGTALAVRGGQLLVGVTRGYPFAIDPGVFLFERRREGFVLTHALDVAAADFVDFAGESAMVNVRGRRAGIYPVLVQVGAPDRRECWPGFGSP